MRDCIARALTATGVEEIARNIHRADYGAY
jgi:hypothetical protein